MSAAADLAETVSAGASPWSRHQLALFAETAAAIVEFRETRIMPEPRLRGAGVWRLPSPRLDDQLTGGTVSV
jgi:hypothetical protein